MMNNAIEQAFGGRLRVRISGLCIDHDRLLLINHKGLTESGIFWSPPGGEVRFKESMEAALRREFLEETNLIINVGEFLCVHEFQAGELHALEVFFQVNVIGGELKIGRDPELGMEDQIIKEVRFVTFDEIGKLPNTCKHDLLHGNLSQKKLLKRNGHFKL